MTAYSVQQSNTWSKQEDYSNYIVKNINDLSYFANIYIISSQNQVISNWNSAYTSLDGNISALIILSPFESTLIQQILTSLQELKQNITSISSLSMTPENQTIILNLWSLVSPQIQNVATNALTLSAMINDKADQIQQASFIYLSLLVGILAAFVIFLYTQIYGHTIKSIDKLQLQEQYLELNNQKLENLVEERTKQLRDAERMATIGEIAGMVGHDIRNPLQAIVSELFLARQTMADAPKTIGSSEALESIDLIQEQVDYINKIVSDLQDYAKPLNPEYSMVNLSDLIVSIFETIPVHDKFKVKIDIQGTIKFKTDPTFIKRALTNLANNAIQAMPEGGELGLTAQKHETRVIITVSDTGQGIPEHVKANLFKPFVTTKAKGQGLGLAVVKRLVEGLNGKVIFESEEGKGTKFTIELPTEG